MGVVRYRDGGRIAAAGDGDGNGRTEVAEEEEEEGRGEGGGGGNTANQRIVEMVVYGRIPRREFLSGGGSDGWKWGFGAELWPRQTQSQLVFVISLAGL